MFSRLFHFICLPWLVSDVLDFFINICVTISGFTSSATHQSFTNAGRFCVQDFWSRKEAWQFDYIHHVPAYHLIQYLNAVVLFSL